MRQKVRAVCVAALSSFLLASCGSPEPVSAERYAPVDELFEAVDRNVAAAPGLTKIVEIDHSRLAAREGEVMPPARVLIFSDTELESRLVARDPLIGIDLPLRVLAFEDTETKQGRVIGNRYAYMASRYGLDDEFKAAYEGAMTTALAGIPPERIAEFDDNDMSDLGIVTIDSAFGFDETLDRVQKAISSQDDTVSFGLVDYAENAKAHGIVLPRATLVLFGAPAPGAKAMSDAPTLGLDGFCQKLLVWEGAEGAVHVSFNDLLALADRHGVGPSLPLRVISRRLNQTFEAAIRAAD